MKIFFTERPISEENLKPFQTTTHIIQYPKEEIADIHTFDRSALIQTIKDLKPDVLVVKLKHVINEELLKDTFIKVVATQTTGLDLIDLEFCKQKNIEIISLRGSDLTDLKAVSELCLAMMIVLMRTLEKPGHELRGKTLGLWGKGRIGTHMEDLGKKHGMNVIFYDPNVQGGVSLEELLEKSEVISIHATSDEVNRGMVSYEHFKQMKQCPFFLNSSRPWLVQDLERALNENLISGAWVDFDLDFKHPKLITTSHRGGDTWESLLKSEQIIVEKVLKYCQNLI